MNRVNICDIASGYHNNERYHEQEAESAYWHLAYYLVI
ncbi:hypothetical protein AGRO_3176 [Agrobacterium sp. ATCC 31749]|nr:hypothetical protein AGRO_3176 [Agrobacterium sp. ATCC 31749]